MSDAPSFTPVPTDIDPCTLLTQAEASTLAGVSLAAGTSSTAESNARMCSYGAEGSVVQLLVAVAPDAASAKAAEPGFKATLEQGVAQAGIANPKLTEMAGFDPGVDAAMVEGSASAAGKKLSAIALYALKGAVIVAISNIGVGSPVASSDDHPGAGPHDAREAALSRKGRGGHGKAPDGRAAGAGCRVGSRD